MLDFSQKIYNKMYQVFARGNFLTHPPTLSLFYQKIDFSKIKQILKKNFGNFSFRCGLYVHFPFCWQYRCTYCRYYSVPTTNVALFDDYLDALERELTLYKVNFSKINLENLYIGGGTPNLLNEKQIIRLIGILHKFFKFKKRGQFALEANPQFLKENNLKALKNHGLNRIVVGVQSFNDPVLKKVRRSHTVKDVFETFDIIRKVGIKYNGIELLLGLPGENRKTYQRTISQTLSLSPDYIDCRLFTPGGMAQIKPQPPLDITLDEVLQLFKNQFTENGYKIYAAGNYLQFIKKPGAINENSEKTYNFQSSCFGLGPSAVSTFPGLKYSIYADLKDYIKNLKKRNSPPDFYGIFYNKETSKRLYVINRCGFYRNLNKNTYFDIFKTKINNDFSKEIDCLKKKGVISETKNKINWHFNETGLEHEDFIFHILKYWYRAEDLKIVLKKYNL